MVMTDPIADMLTRIRNANQMKHEYVEIPASKLKHEILKVIKREGYIYDVEFIPNDKQGILKVTMKYTDRKERVIKGLNVFPSRDSGLRESERGAQSIKRFGNSHRFHTQRSYD